jgi:nitrate/TMAO reductase-like tetraheme cytochrome c subunit
MIANLYRIAGVMVAILLLVLLNWDAWAQPQEKAQTSSEDTSVNNGLSGQELWSMNCRRCHNLQPSTMYSDAQWDVILHHMRVRANLTGEDHRAILEFLKSSH